MVDIFTHSMLEYNTVKAALEGAGVDVNIRKPEDSFGLTAWSVEDARGFFPDVVTDEDLMDFMRRNEQSLKNIIVEGGNESLEDFAFASCHFKRYRLVPQDNQSILVVGYSLSEEEESENEDLGDGESEDGVEVATVYRDKLDVLCPDEVSEWDIGFQRAVEQAQALLNKRSA